MTGPRRLRAREFGIRIGSYNPGHFNAITDVPGVRVGHSTIIKGEGTLVPSKGPVRTGVTAIFPTNANIFQERVVGSGFVLNGAGEVSGLTQIIEWGQIETPILLTNTMAVGACSDALGKYMVKNNPGIGSKWDVILPVVGECDDSWLNDSAGRHVKEEHVLEALERAKSGPVAEGNVGSGTGMITCDFKGGIGTSSRKLPKDQGGFTLGVLVMSNFGVMEDLRVDGLPVGRLLMPKYEKIEKRKESYGSIIVVVGTNAPLSSHQLTRVCKRAALGVGRCGSIAAHASGELVIGFSNGNLIPRFGKRKSYKRSFLFEDAIDPIYRATIEATEEAILNSLFCASTMTGHSNHTGYALPYDELRAIFSLYNEYEKRFIKNLTPAADLGLKKS